jgi:acetylserotonin N-methyltransferase
MAERYEAPSVDDRPIWDMFMSIHILPAVTAADELGVFAAIHDEALPLKDLAARISAEPRALSIVLGMLAALGLVEHRLGRYRATVLARTYLHPDSPFYWGGVFHRQRQNMPEHARLVSMMKARAVDPSSGAVEAWETGQLAPDFARAIAKFMHAHSLPAAIGVARSGLFDGVKSLLDVGAGSGVFGIAVAQRHPKLKATILDLQPMCDAAQVYIDEAGVGDRVSVLPLDMFRQPWPKGHDALFFSNIYHDWNDETCAELSAKAFEALPKGGRIYLHEMLMDDGCDGPVTTAGFSMHMLLNTRGKQYTLGELKGFLEGAGFRDVASTHTCGYYSLVSARTA